MGSRRGLFQKAGVGNEFLRGSCSIAQVDPEPATFKGTQFPSPRVVAVGALQPKTVPSCAASPGQWVRVGGC